MQHATSSARLCAVLFGAMVVLSGLIFFSSQFVIPAIVAGSGYVVVLAYVFGISAGVRMVRDGIRAHDKAKEVARES